MLLELLECKINGMNEYLLNSNCSDFRIENYDGNKLHLIGSFDLCYYHEIKVVFYEVFEICMETSFKLDLIVPPFTIQPFLEEQGLYEINILDSGMRKHMIICENINFLIETVKYSS